MSLKDEHAAHDLQSRDNVFSSCINDTLCFPYDHIIDDTVEAQPKTNLIG